MLSREEILHIAQLAKLELTENEINKYLPQLSEILKYVEKLNEISTDNIEPTSHAIQDLKNRYQDEKTSERTLTNEQVLKNAKETKDGYVVTKGVFEE